MEKLKPIKCIEFLEDKHYYKINGIFCPSVSSILKPISNLIYKDIDEEILEKARQRGVEIHLAIEIYDTTGAEIISDEFKGYFESYKKFRQEHPSLEDMATEYRLYNPVLWYAGTADKIFWDKNEQCLILVDLKTSVKIEFASLIPQITGYWEGLKANNIEIKKAFVLQLKEDGNYIFKDIKPDLNIFISCLSIQNHINKCKEIK